jgi:hypothetical protein
MKNFAKHLLTLQVILILISCSDNPVNDSIPGNLEGTWVYRSYQEDVYTMEKSFNLENDNSGLVILGNGSFVERKNIGFCGTPPVVYDNYQGNWKSLSDTKLKVTVGYWGGTENFTMDIISVTNSVLKFRKSMIQ